MDPRAPILWCTRSDLNFNFCSIPEHHCVFFYSSFLCRFLSAKESLYYIYLCWLLSLPFRLIHFVCYSWHSPTLKRFFFFYKIKPSKSSLLGFFFFFLPQAYLIYLDETVTNTWRCLIHFFFLTMIRKHDRYSWYARILGVGLATLNCKYVRVTVLIPNILSTECVFTFLHLYTVLIYNRSIRCDPEEDGCPLWFWFLSRFFPHVVSSSLSPLARSLGI